jgi:hypothetical protein
MVIVERRNWSIQSFSEMLIGLIERALHIRRLRSGDQAKLEGSREMV